MNRKGVLSTLDEVTARCTLWGAVSLSKHKLFHVSDGSGGCVFSIWRQMTSYSAGSKSHQNKRAYSLMVSKEI
jgi:hypothetical protein